MSYIVEKDWLTSAGFRAVVTMGSMGHRCGYVGVNKDHPLYEKDYNDSLDCINIDESEEIGKRSILSLLCARKSSPLLVFDVHGGITYAGGGGSIEDNKYPVISDLWWFGYDCNHLGDAKSPEYIDKEFSQDHAFYSYSDGIHRSLDYCIDECESLATQFLTKVKV